MEPRSHEWGECQETGGHLVFIGKFIGKLLISFHWPLRTPWPGWGPEDDGAEPECASQRPALVLASHGKTAVPAAEVGSQLVAPGAGGVSF